MTTWRHGRAQLFERLHASAIPLTSFLDSLFRTPPQRVAGTAVFLTSARDVTPNSLLHSLKHYKVLHERNVFMTVEFRDLPWVAVEARVACEKLEHDCWRVRVRYGFMDRPDIGAALERCGPAGLQVEPMDVTYFVSRDKVVASGEAKSPLARWRDSVFAAMARNAGGIGDFFNIPANRLVELGTRVEI